MHNDLTPHVYDAYLVGQTGTGGSAPHLLPPLEKALALALEHHVILYPPSKLHSSWLAGVYSQDPESDRHYTISHSSGSRYTCTCPCFAKQMYTHKGRTYCAGTLCRSTFSPPSSTSRPSKPTRKRCPSIHLIKPL